MKELLRHLLARQGYALRRLTELDYESEFLELHAKAKDYTMTSIERQYALYQAVRYLADNGIPGAFVECGVWKGGSTMLALMTLLRHGAANRDVYLYDTFAGMSEPTDEDVNMYGTAARGKWHGLLRGPINEWDYASLEEVREHVATASYPAELIRYIAGKVEHTIPGTLPERIALLRLDTDWYESTKHELTHLFPLLVPGGILIIDDYGHWQGARKAVDEYFKETGHRIFLNRIDYTGRIAVKVA